MSFKPSDFYVGIVDFLGALVPGAVFVFIHRERVLRTVSLSSVSEWVVFLGAAYIAGQLLLALSEKLNGPASWFLKIYSPRLHKEIDGVSKKASSLLEPATAGNMEPFHAALSYVRLENGEAAAEIDRHMADYKLLRNLVAVFSADFLVTLWTGPRTCERLGSDILLAVLSFLAFARMLGWARLLAFQYCCLIATPERPSGKK